jgi:dUTP pyrophosphatase
MKVKIKRIDKSLPLPEYKTKGAAAFDLAAREEVLIKSTKCGYVPLNVCIAPPRGHMVILAARSSLHKKGLMMANGIGIGDEDFSGNDDEYKAALYNFTDSPIKIERGERVVQAIILPVDGVEWEEVDNMESETRGGFGSTGF